MSIVPSSTGGVKFHDVERIDPRLVIRGSPTLLGEGLLPLEPFRFDAYAATFNYETEQVTSSLQRTLPSLRVVRPFPMFGYEFGAELTDGVDLVHLLWRAPGRAENHIRVQGEASVPVSNWLRSCFPTHRVSRADSCVDFEYEGAFEHIAGLALDLAEAFGLNTRTDGDWLSKESPAGRTLYIGSRQSTTMVRIYEKGKQLRAKGHTGDFRPFLVRVEVECKPDGDRRSEAALASPEAVFRSGLMTDAFADVLLGRCGDRLASRGHKKVSELERALRFLVRQYGAKLLEKSEQLGSAELLGRYLVDLVGEIAAAKGKAS